MKFKGNKRLALTLITLSVIFSFFGGTLAYLSWRTSESQKTLVSVVLDDIGSLTIDGGNIEHMGMYPTADCDGEAALIGDVATATAYNATKADIEVILKLRASLSVTQNELTEEKKSKINWALVDTSTEETCETTPYRGTMASVTTNTDIDSGVSFIASADGTTIRTYRIYVWLDSTYTHTNYLNVVSDPMQELSISVTFSPASELVQSESSVSGGPNAPVLDNGMIPIKISADGVATTVSQTDSTWYNYDNKEWANVVLVKSSGTKTRDYYKTNTGVTVAEDDILAYYVWIPRYKYRIPQTKCSDLDSPTIETYPECYGAPYIMSDTDKSTAITWWQQSMINNMGVEYTTAQATTDVNNLLNDGTAYIEAVGEPISLSIFEDLYNSSNETPLSYTATFYDDNISSDGVAKSIDIVFESEAAEMSEGDAVDTYRTHPAFWWDDNSNGNVDDNEKVPGIWVGKFKVSANTDSDCYTTYSSTTSVNYENCAASNISPRIVPNVRVLEHQNVSMNFITAQKFSASGNIYGISNTNSHMMKNSEWGAIAYLSHSKYGINSEVYTNNSAKDGNAPCFVGRSSGHIGNEFESNKYGNYTWIGQVISSSGVIGDFASDRTFGTNASTTGNVSGIYDIAGGGGNRVMAVLADADGIPRSGTLDCVSGFNGLGVDYSGNSGYCTSGINFPASKYYDLYTSDDLNAACDGGICYGHALTETAGWYGDSSSFVFDTVPWVVRGGQYSQKSSGVFNFDVSSGKYESAVFRSVLIVGYGQ